MRALSFALLLATSAACGGSASRPTHADRAAPTTAPTTPASDLGSLPIAQYLGSDDATGQRVRELLQASGIKSSAGGSLGYSVWVDAPDRPKARAILLAAAANECLAVTVFDDQAQMLTSTRPAHCDPPAPPAPVDHSK
jgi:hypothetical protein